MTDNNMPSSCDLKKDITDIRSTLKKCDAGFIHLFGDPFIPNDNGMLPRIEKHLDRLNGQVQHNRENIIKLWVTVFFILGSLGIGTGLWKFL